MASNIAVTELDFATIKQNIKTFLRGQSEFTDFDFDGSAISVLIDALAYAAHITAVQANMSFNEIFLDSATLRNSVISRAKELNYLPRSETAAQATVNMVVADVNDPSSINVPKGTKFSSTIDNETYIFSTVTDQVLARVTAGNYAGDVTVYQGEYQQSTFTVTSIIDGVIQNKFVIQDTNIDTRFLTVDIEDTKGASSFSWVITDDITDVSSASLTFYLQEVENEHFEIYFGAGLIGKQPVVGNYITTDYLVTAGVDGNLVNNFTLISTISSNEVNYTPNLFTVTTVDKSFGGRARESIAEIKVMAPKYYETQGRAVTVDDYKVIMLKQFPEIETLSVWGGEEEIPAQFGKVFISVKPIYGTTFPPTTLDEMEIYMQRKNIVGVTSEIVSPQLIYVNIISVVKFDGQSTTQTEGQIRSLIQTTMFDYIDNQSEVFDQGIDFSPTISKIDTIHDSIESNITAFSLSHKFIPSTTVNNDYQFDYANVIDPSSVVSTWTGVDTTTAWELKDDGLGILHIYKDGILFLSNAGGVDYAGGIINLSNFLPDVATNTTFSLTVSPISNDLLSRRRALLVAGDMTGINVYDSSKVGGSFEAILFNDLTDAQKAALGL